MLVILRDFESVFVFWRQPEGPELGLIGHPKHLLLLSGNGFEVFPTGNIQKVVVLGI
jgi:hypothetical protein